MFVAVARTAKLRLLYGPGSKRGLSWTWYALPISDPHAHRKKPALERTSPDARPAEIAPLFEAAVFMEVRAAFHMLSTQSLQPSKDAQRDDKTPRLTLPTLLCQSQARDD